jgi:hypothetical protein
MFFPDGGDFTIKDILKSFQYQEPTSAFRTKFDYDNLLYMVAGELIMRVSGLSWADFVQLRIFNPLGMNNSVAVDTRLNENTNLALPHSSYEDSIVQLKNFKTDEVLGAAGGIYSSVNDLSKWLLLHLNGGKYGKDLSEKIFTEKRQKEMWQPYTNIWFDINPDPRTNTHFSAYGLGWNISDIKGKIIIQHTGGLPGMLSRTILVPELNLGIIVLTNSAPGGYGYYSISETILDSYMGIEQKDWINDIYNQSVSQKSKSDSVTTAVWDVVSKAKNKHIDFSNYIGTYKDNWFGNIKIELKNGKLWFTSLRSPKLTGEMFYYKANTFAIKWNYQDMPCDAFAMFNLDENGKAISIKMKGISPNIDFSFDFHDLDLKRIEE